MTYSHMYNFNIYIFCRAFAPFDFINSTISFLWEECFYMPRLEQFSQYTYNSIYPAENVL